ncbi:MAG: mechanosensitive ion channel domain-containing protein [Candidatus Eisenbacteria bacterium]
MNFGVVWHYAIATVEGESITVGAIATALLLFVAGYFVSRLLSRTISRAMARRSGMDEGATTAIETLGFYVLFVVFGFTSLTIIHFPMTVFTLAGGAVAIGVGFGSQQVMRNFISGILIHLERPIRAGDLVEIEGIHGTVERIGPRSTRIRAANNTHIILPNSFFLDNMVVNLTLSDDILRTSVRVGVAYGSPTRDVERLLLEVIDANPQILKEREPRIVFADFGDNSLQFDVYFWVRAKAIIDRRMVESAVRHGIDARLREAGVVIAFPQRDVHFDPARPLTVRVLGEGPDGVS